MIFARTFSFIVALTVDFHCSVSTVVEENHHYNFSQFLLLLLWYFLCISPCVLITFKQFDAHANIFFLKTSKTDIRLEMIKSVSRNLNYEFHFFASSSRSMMTREKGSQKYVKMWFVKLPVSWHILQNMVLYVNGLRMCLKCEVAASRERKTSWHFDSRFLSIFITKWNFLWSKTKISLS